ncbi:MAG: type II toxin-antitoxin system HicB family antitoxin [Chitinophagaceae bacterium]|nr:type II toxin-antitoxin system HicB family antitoxin [Anaerolineae bacterium]
MRQVILIPDYEDGGYTVEVPSLPGCISEGNTLEEALANIKDAIEGYIEIMIAHGEDVPSELSHIIVANV